MGHTTEETNIQTSNIPQDFVITYHKLFGMCTLPEWGLVGRIANELHQYNAIWFIGKDEKRKSSSLRSAIKGLIKLGVIIKTENPEFYIVNPVYIRRGNPFKVLATTAEEIHREKGLDQSVRGNKRPINKYNVDIFHLSGIVPNNEWLGPLKR
jgi:hypothetical protein